MMNEPQLPPLPPAEISPYDYEGENGPTDYGWYEQTMRAYGLSCYQAGVAAERELWSLLDAHGIHLSRAYIRDNSGRWHGWWGCGPKGAFIGRGDTMHEAAESCAAAIRKAE